jgi:methionine synthase II (cobalamin-independent)
VIDEEKERMFFDTTGDVSEKLDIFYEKYVTKDMDYFQISKDFSAGYHTFEHALKKEDLSNRQFLKGQITGPISFGLTVTDQDKKSILYNEELSDSIVKGCAMKALWQVTRLKNYLPNVIIFIDEPYLSSFGSAFINLTREQVIEYLNEVIEVIHEADGVAGIHCCGNTDWSILMDTNVDIINFDAYEYFQGMTLYPEKLKSYFARNGVLAWGVVPSTDKIKNEDSDSLLEFFEKEIDELAQKGFEKSELLDKCIISPSCGMGSLTVDLSNKILQTTSELSVKLREKYYKN